MSRLPPVIDLHCHVAGEGHGRSGCYISRALAENWRYRVFQRAFGVPREEVELRGDAAVCRKIAGDVGASTEVDRAVILAFDAVIDRQGEVDRDRTHLYVPNRFVARMVREHPNLLFGASVNPYRRDALERLARAAEEGAVLLKWLPPVQRIDPSDRALRAFYELLAALGLPLLVHTGPEAAFPDADATLGGLAQLRQPLELGVTVIAAHAGVTAGNFGRPDARQLEAMMEAFPRLYADISSLTQVNRLRALEPLLASPLIRERLLYGTDMPLLATPAVDPAYFAFRLPWQRCRELRRIRNPWDQDVALKRALGVDDGILRRGGALLKLPSRPGAGACRGTGEAPPP